MLLFEKCTFEELNQALLRTKTEEPRLVWPFWTGLNSYLSPQIQNSQVKMLIDSVKIQCIEACTSSNEEERLKQLIDCFFHTQGFQLHPATDEPNQLSEWLILDVLQSRRGHPLIISHLFCFLAEQVHLPISLVNHQSLSVVKWVHKKKSYFINLLKDGQLLSQQEIANLLSEIQVPQKDWPSLVHLKPLDRIENTNIILGTLMSLLKLFERSFDEINQLKILNLLLSYKPENLDWLEKRALTYKNMGSHKLAMADIKRYFSFNEKQYAPNNIKLAFYELQSIDTNTQPKVIH